jgi:hypothetical protein
MPRFYFHIEDGETVCDREGQFFLDIEDARQAALRSAREMLAAGSLDGGDRIVIADENGNAIMAVPLAEAARATQH